MKSATVHAPSPPFSPGYLAYKLLHIGLTAAPIVAGADKFFNRLTNWEKYLSPIFAAIIPADVFMLVVGAFEIFAGLLVALRPRVGAYVVAAWLLGIIMNLLLLGDYYDIALRDFGLALGAFALGSLSRVQPKVE
jgi:uncharacterized membrane protein YphA (DoxX/SURF4 family)